MNAVLRNPLIVAAGLVLLAPSVGAAQGRRGGGTLDWAQGDLLLPIDVDPIVTNAPYSADAITTVTQTLGDGTKIERTVTAKIFRDSMGRMRREQTVIGLAALTPAQDAQQLITITDPVERVTITLDERARTARRSPMPALYFRYRQGAALLPQAPDTHGLSVGVVATRRLQGDALAADITGLALSLERSTEQLQLQRRGGRGSAPAAPPASLTTPLGVKTLEGVSVSGHRTTQTIPTGQIGNDRPIVISDEVWESDVLKVVVSSKHVDPRTGTVDYHLANLRLGEPSADLFMIPAGYTVTGAPPLPGGSGGAGPPAPASPPVPGQRSGGGRGRAAQ